MFHYVTRAGDMLDAICFRYYGESRDYTEAVREANPQLANVGAVLPNGITLNLPDLDDIATQQQVIRLWN